MHRRKFIGIIVLCLWVSSAIAQEDVPGLVGQLARERSYAEGGAALLKRWINEDRIILKGHRLYTDANVASDEAIATLAATLTTQATPELNETLRLNLNDAIKKRIIFSEYVDASLDKIAGKKNVVGDALGAATGEIVKALIEAAVEIWKTERAADEGVKETIRHQIEAERWRNYSDISSI